MFVAKDKRPARGTYLGGQQVAAICGMHPYKTAGDVWLEARGEGDNVDPQKPAIRRGRIVEPGLLNEALNLDRVLGIIYRDVFVQDDDIPFFGGTLDAFVTDPEQKTVYEVTTCTTRTRHLWGAPGTDDCAKYKWIQSQWYMGLTGAERARIWCLSVDDGDLFDYWIPRRDTAIDSLRDAAADWWWQHVIGGEPPRIDLDVIDAFDASEMMDRIYRAAVGGKELEAQQANHGAVRQLANDYAKARTEEKLAQEEKVRASAQMKELMTEHTLCKFDEGRVSWTRNRPTEKLDEDRLLEALAKKAGVDDVALAAMKTAYTAVKDGPRILRVTMKEKP